METLLKNMRNEFDKFINSGNIISIKRWINEQTFDSFPEFIISEDIVAYTTIYENLFTLTLDEEYGSKNKVIIPKGTKIKYYSDHKRDKEYPYETRVTDCIFVECDILLKESKTDDGSKFENQHRLINEAMLFKNRNNDSNKYENIVKKSPYNIKKVPKEYINRTIIYIYLDELNCSLYHLNNTNRVDSKLLESLVYILENIDFDSLDIYSRSLFIGAILLVNTSDEIPNYKKIESVILDSYNKLLKYDNRISYNTDLLECLQFVRFNKLCVPQHTSVGRFITENDYRDSSKIPPLCLYV